MARPGSRHHRAFIARARHQQKATLIQYGGDSSGQGALRIAVATSDSVRNDPTAWTYSDFVAGDFGWPTADMDYPDMSYSNRYLYVSTDVIGSGRVVMRVKLEELRDGGTITFEYTEPADAKNVWGAHLVQQTTDIGLWAGHQDNSLLLLYRWPDGGDRLPGTPSPSPPDPTAPCRVRALTAPTG